MMTWFFVCSTIVALAYCVTLNKRITRLQNLNRAYCEEIMQGEVRADELRDVIRDKNREILRLRLRRQGRPILVFGARFAEYAANARRN